MIMLSDSNLHKKGWLVRPQRLLFIYFQFYLLTRLFFWGGRVLLCNCQALGLGMSTSFENHRDQPVSVFCWDWLKVWTNIQSIICWILFVDKWVKLLGKKCFEKRQRENKFKSLQMTYRSITTYYISFYVWGCMYVCIQSVHSTLRGQMKVLDPMELELCKLPHGG